MKVYVFQAALLCNDCGVAAANGLEYNEDSDHFPNGPWPDGGGEADCPQHCDHCGVFLENPLTPDGDTYVRKAAKEFEIEPDMSWDEIAAEAEAASQPVLGEWIRFYFQWG